MKSDTPNSCTVNTARTPQQASIESREAREAWERGASVQCRYKDHEWSDDIGNPPNFSHENLEWRVKPTPTPVIGPGKWRTRQGNVVTVGKNFGCNALEFPFKACDGVTYRTDGTCCFNREVQQPYDLLTRVETRWRPWKPDEVPLGKIIRTKSHGSRWLISGINNCGDIYVAGDEGSRTPQFILNEYELLNPDGTYSPCGVEEEVG